MSFAAVGDPASVEIVRAEFDCHFVAREDTDEELSHSPGDMGKNHVTIIQLDTKHRVRKGFFNRPFHFNCIFFRQTRTPFLRNIASSKPKNKKILFDSAEDTMVERRAKGALPFFGWRSIYHRFTKLQRLFLAFFLRPSSDGVSQSFKGRKERMARNHGRAADAIRKIQIEPGFSTYAESVVFRIGKTVVHCSAMVEAKLPPFVEQGIGWISAEYAMLPSSARHRVQREKRGRIDDRAIEIQRLIGRSLRSIVDLRKMADIFIILDSDVLNADGGTRCASICGSYLALALALRKLEKEGKIRTSEVLRHEIAAVSVGIVKGQILLDLDYAEDSKADVDLNLVMTGDKKLVELQATGEDSPFEISQLQEMLQIGSMGIQEILSKSRAFLKGG